MNYQGFTANEGNSPTVWQQLMANYTLAQNANPTTMLGFVLGKYLHDAYDDYQDRRWANKKQGGTNTNYAIGPAKYASLPSTKYVPENSADVFDNQMMRDAVNKAATNTELKQGLLNGISTAGAGYLNAVKQNIANNSMQQAINSLPSGSDFHKRFGNGVNYTNGFNSTTYF